MSAIKNVPMTVARMIRLLEVLPQETIIEQATDEEGNGFSPVIAEGMEYDKEEGKLFLFPLFVYQD